MSAEHDEVAEAWPCDDYKPPLTCWTTPKPKTLICTGCRAAFPDGPKVQALLAERDAKARAAALGEAADAWQQGQWADAPRCADRVQERLANAQHVTDWLRSRAARSDQDGAS